MDKKSRQEWADSVLTGISGGCQCVRGHHTTGFPTEWGAVIRPGPGEAQAQQGHRAHHLRRVQAKPQRPLRQPEHQSHLLRALLHELRLSRTRPKESTQGAPPLDLHTTARPGPHVAGNFFHPSPHTGRSGAGAVAAPGPPPSLLRRGPELLHLDSFQETHCEDCDGISCGNLQMVHIRWLS